MTENVINIIRPSKTLSISKTENVLAVNSSGPQGIGVPSGGSLGQVLSKSSANDYDTIWSTPTVSFAAVTDRPTTLSGYGILDAQPKNDNLTSISGLPNSSGLLKKNSEGDWSLDLNTYLTANQPITITGDASGYGATVIDVSLNNSGVQSGVYGEESRVPEITVDSDGRITSAQNLDIRISGNSVVSGTVAEARIDDSIARTANPEFNGVVTIGGGVRVSFKDVISNYSIQLTDYVINCNNGPYTLTLPDCENIRGQEFVLNNSGSDIITISAYIGQTINKESSHSLGLNESIKVVADGISNWVII